ncbi:MAG: Bug family tripartite tricarboxylate transporter substrate binding protein [Burkholderiales bacterium]
MSASAQSYPNRPVRLVMPFPPGGNVDAFGRILARQIEGHLGQPVVVDNRAGANGIIGVDIVAKAPPDGYTLLDTSFSFVINPSIYRKLPYDTEKDFAPITNFAMGLGYVLTAHPSVPVQTVRDLVALAKKTPLRYSSPGVGNGQHLAGELLATKAGIQLLHVPYKGGGPALTAVLGGEVQLTFTAAAVGAPHIKSGKLRALGFSGAARLASLPEVPTIAESGVPDFVYDSGWHGLFAPAKTPASVVNRLYTEVAKAVQEPKLREFLIAGGYEPKADPPAEFTKLFRADIKKYGDIVKAAHIEQQ